MMAGKDAELPQSFANLAARFGAFRDLNCHSGLYGGLPPSFRNADANTAAAAGALSAGRGKSGRFAPGGGLNKSPVRGCLRNHPGQQATESRTWSE
jgi:hypothetical protein